MSRLYPERPFLAASVAVFREGRVLIAERASGAGIGSWSLPGGMVETGERLGEAALRELFEETGVRAELAGFVDTVEIIGHD
ncbi:MAG TPA: NUDIX domain-containing protein, partial [Beijerinckiaceae bacterium]|nr:NUDIX domain-containing protein [Beijerinckiaceae bacterium]